MTEPFKRDEFLDKPGIVGARWWHEGLAQSDPAGRRTALKALLVGGGLLAVSVLVSKSCTSEPDTTTVSRNSLEMQKEYGWSFGAAAESLTFDGTTLQPYDPALASRLATDLAPTQASLRPYFIPTLLQSIGAAPRSVIPGDPPVIPLLAAVHPIATSGMASAYRRGLALASLFKVGVPGVAVVVDLPGPESIAFAAGASSVFEPVLAIDNWPHPRGVVPAHLTLAAALFYQPRFTRTATARQAASTVSSVVPPPPMFVLDRSRLTPYTDEIKQFDNRHLARLPPTTMLTALGITHILYVVPTDADIPELNDLNSPFVSSLGAGITVKIVASTAWSPEPVAPPPFDTSHPTPAAGSDAAMAKLLDTMSDELAKSLVAPYFYGGSAATNDAFWVDYPWVTPPRTGPRAASVSTRGRDYVPMPRIIPQPGNEPGAVPGFGMVRVVVAASTGAILGAVISRSGSWNRSSGGWSSSGSWGGG